jgi:membrane-bound lytic murein transglycosylase A
MGMLLMFAASPSQSPAAASEPFAGAREVAFETLDGFADEDHLAGFQTFLKSCRAIVAEDPPLRPGAAAPEALRAVCRKALAQRIESRADARQFFTRFFKAYHVPAETGGQGFLTGYYEPVIDGSLQQTEAFTTPVLARPDDLVTFLPGETPPGFDAGLSAARIGRDGAFEPYPERGAIEQGALGALARPLVWLADPIEVFLLQVQGSGRVHLPDGRLLRLVYAGRNGQPYTSIGRILIQEGHIPEPEMSLARLKQWMRAAGQKNGKAGAALMWRNKSYVFFAIDDKLDPAEGPIGGAGIPLDSLRSIAVDRTLWPYGLPFWIAADLPWQGSKPSGFRRLMIAQDTGSAILGRARADIFFGTGTEAGTRAGDIRHRGDFFVLWPRTQEMGGETGP